MPSATPTTVPSQTSTTTTSSSYSSTSTLGSPPTTLSSYNNTMLSYTRAQFQQFRDTASTTVPELGEARKSSSTAGTNSSSGSVSRKGNEGPRSPVVAVHDFASGSKA
ncbi:hypothetical protein V496_10275 [Pseudogymnoascus sp. VKM F-4515 (FW-2607)]|nr:hypothetical protein V496_10275 [Pseudogymnoascus sp. VKM F-4515 (FW-2607)]KFY70115.1 hypothetical protein V498_10391 [Pseudogymnoascus sp. VKM F-4517 (FW-2822)]